MRANNSLKPISSKRRTKKKNNSGIVTPKFIIFLKHISKNYLFYNTIIIVIGIIMSIILLGIAKYFNTIDWKVSCIPLMIGFILTSLLTAIKHRYKKL